jgi:hypothetical protein
MNQAMGIETGKLTSQTEGVMNNYYIDPKIVALGERAARDLRIFGENGTNTSRRNKKDSTISRKVLIIK